MTDWKAEHDHELALRREWSERAQKAEEGLAYVNKCLDKSVELQSHYARLLNEYDGGKRMTFRNGDAWMIRLRQLEK